MYFSKFQTTHLPQTCILTSLFFVFENLLPIFHNCFLLFPLFFQTHFLIFLRFRSPPALFWWSVCRSDWGGPICTELIKTFRKMITCLTCQGLDVCARACVYECVCLSTSICAVCVCALAVDSSLPLCEPWTSLCRSSELFFFFFPGEVKPQRFKKVTTML